MISDRTPDVLRCWKSGPSKAVINSKSIKAVFPYNIYFLLFGASVIIESVSHSVTRFLLPQIAIRKLIRNVLYETNL